MDIFHSARELSEGLGRCLAAWHWSERKRGIMAFASPARRLAAICARGVSAQPQVSAVSPVGSVRAPLALPLIPSAANFSAHATSPHASRPRSPPAVQLTPSFLPLSRFQTFDGLIARCLSSSAAPGWHCDRRGGGLRGRRARGGRDVPWNAATACDDLASGGGASAAGSRGTFASSRAPRAIRGFHTSSARAGDYYETLGVARSASQGEIKKAYYKLAKKYHPDANKDDPSAETRFQEVQKAYETLRDPQSRGMYDQVGHGNYEQMENGGGGGAGAVSPAARAGRASRGSQAASACTSAGTWAAAAAAAAAAWTSRSSSAISSEAWAPRATFRPPCG